MSPREVTFRSVARFGGNSGPRWWLLSGFGFGYVSNQLSGYASSGLNVLVDRPSIFHAPSTWSRDPIFLTEAKETDPVASTPLVTSHHSRLGIICPSRCVPWQCLEEFNLMVWHSWRFIGIVIPSWEIPYAYCMPHWPRFPLWWTLIIDTWNTPSFWVPAKLSLKKGMHFPIKENCPTALPPGKSATGMSPFHFPQVSVPVNVAMM
jgi:hypothetical protein